MGVPAKRKRAWGHFCMEPFSYHNYHYYSLLKCGFFFSWCHVIFYFEKPPNTFSLHLEFTNLSSSMIFLIGSRCHHFLFIKMCFFFSWWYHLLFWKTTEHISLHLEFKNLSSSMIFFIQRVGSRCHLFLFHIKIGVCKRWITLNTHWKWNLVFK